MQDVISRVQALEAEGRITGVMDDRGKVCYVYSRMLMQFGVQCSLRLDELSQNGCDPLAF